MLPSIKHRSKERPRGPDFASQNSAFPSGLVSQRAHEPTDLHRLDVSATGQDEARVVDIAPVKLHKGTQPEWDAFAQECGASFRSSYSWLRAWHLKWLFRGRLHTVQIHHSGKKIGQCAVGFLKHKKVFLDKIILIPEAEALWGECMNAVLKHLGPGIYEYGWNLNLERAREADLSTISGVTVDTARPITVHAVDFQKWPSFEEYWASTSNNTRRNAKRAEAGNFKIVTHANSRGLLHLGAVVRLRASMYERKGIKFQQFRALTSYILDHAISADYRITAIASDRGGPLAAFTGCEFGSQTYYLAGGSRAHNNGIAWYLQKVMLQRAWDRTGGRAKFVMGHVDYSTHNEDTGGGLLRARRAINVSEYATSIVTFTYKKGLHEES